MKVKRYKEDDKEMIEFTYLDRGVEKTIRLAGRRDLETDSLNFRCSVEFIDDVINLINRLDEK
jgi:hypothetical protein